MTALNKLTNDMKMLCPQTELNETCLILTEQYGEPLELFAVRLDYICIIMYKVESIFIAKISRNNHGKAGKCGDDIHLAIEETKSQKG